MYAIIEAIRTHGMLVPKILSVDLCYSLTDAMDKRNFLVERFLAKNPEKYKELLLDSFTDVTIMDDKDDLAWVVYMTNVDR